MTDAIERVVFDCNVYAQALITPAGKSGQCIQNVLDGRLRLFWSKYVLDEIRRIPEKPTPMKLGVTRAMAESLIGRLFPIASFVTSPPSVYQHPVDPKDSLYVDLAVATDSKLIVSSDKHLRNLMRTDLSVGADFMRRFPNLRVLQPWELIDLLRPLNKDDET